MSYDNLQYAVILLCPKRLCEIDIKNFLLGQCLRELRYKFCELKINNEYRAVVSHK